MLNIVSANHYNEAWGDPFVLRPERWLENKTPEGYFVPFSRGPRNCIGQELAMIEIRCTLAMTVADIDFKLCMDELNKLKGDGSGYSSDEKGIQELHGVEMYQSSVMAKPREGMPVRLSLHKT